MLTEIIRVSGLINKSLDLSQLLEAIMLSSKSVFRTEACSVLLLDDTKEYLYFHTVLGEKRDEVTKVKVPVGKGIAGMVVQDKKPMIINDAMNDPRVYREVDKASHFVTRNIMAAPLLVEGQVIGVIETINTIDRNSFTEEDLELFFKFFRNFCTCNSKDWAFTEFRRCKQGSSKKSIGAGKSIRTFASSFLR
nr:Stage II sporulation protein E [Leptospira interrogans serovar Copenhageni/Icterohaemorrhagiae]